MFSIIAAQFTSSELLKPYLFKYLETSAYDKRRAYHGTALVCLHNLRKTFKYGGRRNVPSIEEISAITAGRNSKRQIYRYTYYVIINIYLERNLNSIFLLSNLSQSFSNKHVFHFFQVAWWHRTCYQYKVNNCC